MSDVLLIVRREFLTRARSRGYLLATVVGLLAIVALNLAPSLIEQLSGRDHMQLAIVDQTAGVAREAATMFRDRLPAEFSETLSDGSPRFVFAPVTADRAEADALIEQGEVDGYVVLTGAAADGSWPSEVAVVTGDTLGAVDAGRLSAGFSAAATYVRLQALGVSPQEAQGLFAPVRVTPSVLGGGPASEEEEAESWSLTYALVFLLYITIAIYGTYVAMGVIEEKSSRVVEILVSTVRPVRLMLGKVIGLGGVALLQYAVWIGAGLTLLLVRGSVAGQQLGPLRLQFSDIDAWLLVAFGWFFTIGFFQYASLFAAGGSMVSRSEDANQVTGPLMMVLVTVFFLAMYAMGNPDSGLTMLLAQLPLAGPIVMFVRVALGDPAWWEIALSVVISVATVAGLLWVAARIYRAGILLYGQRMSFRAIGRALR